MEDKKMTLAQEMERVTQELSRLHNLLTDVVPALDNREVISEETTGTCRVIIARIHEHEYIVIPDTASTVVETLRLACSAELKPYEAAGKLRELMEQLRAYSVQYQPKAKIELRKEPKPTDATEDKHNPDHSPSNLTSSQTADQNPDGDSDDDKQADNAPIPQEHTADKAVPDDKSKDGDEQPNDEDGTQSVVNDDEVELEDSDREELDFHLSVTPGMLKAMNGISITFNNN